MKNEEYIHKVNEDYAALSDIEKTEMEFTQSSAAVEELISDEKVVEYVTDRLGDLDFDYDDLEKGVEIEFAFSVNHELISFRGETENFVDDTRMGTGCEHGLYDVKGEVTVSDLRTGCVRKTLPYYEKGFEYEWITDEWSYYGVRQSDFL